MHRLEAGNERGKRKWSGRVLAVLVVTHNFRSNLCHPIGCGATRQLLSLAAYSHVSQHKLLTKSNAIANGPYHSVGQLGAGAPQDAT